MNVKYLEEVSEERDLSDDGLYRLTFILYAYIESTCI